MRDFLRAGLVVVCLMLALIPGAWAFMVTEFQVHPPNEWLPGTPVAVSGTIDFAPLPGEKFDAGHDLRFNTTLENVQWDWTSSVKGVVTPVPTHRDGIIGPVRDNAFHYPKNDNVILKFLLMGEAPAVKQTTNITILRIQEVDETGILIPGSSREYGEVVVYSEGPVEKANSVRVSLEAFRIHLDEKTAEGVNTTLAETKYQLAQQKIGNSSTLASSYYNALIEKYRILDSAQRDIDDGERLLDKAWAEKQIEDTQILVNQTDAIIGWFRGNSSTAHDTRLITIVAKREVAVSYIITARDEIDIGRYSQAREKAQEAFLKANESYYEGLFIQQNPPKIIWDPPQGNNKFRVPLFTFLIVVLIILIAGIFWWRTRKGTKPE